MIKRLVFIFTTFTLVSCSSTRTFFDIFSVDEKLETIKDEEILLSKTVAENQEEKKKTVFIDVAKQYGLKDIKAYNINVVDLNADGHSDIVILPTIFSEPKFYYFNPFENKYALGKSPFQSAVKASYILFYDLNGDSILDAVTAVLNQKSEMSKEPFKIFYGKRDELNNLEFVMQETKVEASPNASIGLIDYDLDGQLDFFIGNWFSRYEGHLISAQDFLFQKEKNDLINVSSILEGETKKNKNGIMFINAKPTYGVQVCDMDQDGFPDILTTSTNQFANKMWMNRYRFRSKKRYFEDVGIVSGYASDTEGLLNAQGGGRTFGVACADYNNDGIMDVFLGELTHNYDNEGVDRSSMLTGRTLKNTPRFFRTEYTQDSFDPNWHQGDRRGIWVDLNSDGLLDLVVENSGYPPYTKLIYFEQHPDHSFIEKSKDYGISLLNPISSVTIDVNQDGKMDLLVSQSSIRDDKIEPKLYLYENRIENENRSLRVFLRGKKSNYHGLNATVTLRVKTEWGYSYRKQVVSYSYGALPPQNEEGLHFGLKKGDELISLNVKWPYSDKSQSAKNILTRTYKINEKFAKTITVTLCEKGNYFVGRRECYE